MKFKEVRIPTKDLNRIYHYIRRESADHQVITSNILSGNYLDELRATIDLRPKCPSAFLHWVLAFPKSDVSRLTPELISKVWRRFFQILEVPATCKYLTATHGTDLQHSHTLLSRVGTDGSVYLARFSVRKGIKATAALEKEFGLTVTATLDYSQRPQSKPAFTKHEYEQKRRTGAPVRKEVITGVIDRAIATSQGSFTTFLQSCARNGVVGTVIERANGSKGISFTFDSVSYRGSKIGKGYSYSQLTKRVELMKEPKAQAADPALTQDAETLSFAVASAPAQALASTASKAEKQEAEGHKQTILERLEKLRADCPKELLYIVTLLFYVVAARLYVPKFYFLLREQVKGLERSSQDIKREEVRSRAQIARELVRR